MARHIQITIPEPCHENWDKMSPAEQGAFCHSCQKTVIDFTGMNDEKLAAFFRKSNTSVCGRFREEQLEKDLFIPQKRVPWIKYFFQIALPAVLFSYKGYAQDIKGKVVAKPARVELPAIKLTEKDTQPFQVHKKQVLTGRVVDAGGNGISYASIWRKNSTQGTATDSTGYFRLTVDEMDSLISFKISSIGYMDRDIEADLTKGNAIPVIQLEESKDILFAGEVVVTRRVAPARKEPALIPEIMDNTSRHFKVFPNPIVAGSSLNIELTNKLKEGYYNLLVIGLDGKQAFRKEIWIDAEAKVMSIELPAITAGNYIISLKNRKTGKAFGEKLMIQ